MKAKLFLISAVLAIPCTVHAQQSALVTERTLGVDAAMQAAQTALESCRKSGFNVTVTVVNRAGRSKVVLHDDKAGPHTIENSYRKAYTSITSRGGEPSGDLGRRLEKSPAPHAMLHLQNFTSAEGALPIRASNNELVGAIGVSGAPGGDKDAVCAQAGIDRIKGGL